MCQYIFGKNSQVKSVFRDVQCYEDSMNIAMPSCYCTIGSITGCSCLDHQGSRGGKRFNYPQGKYEPPTNQGEDVVPDDVSHTFDVDSSVDVTTFYTYS